MSGNERRCAEKEPFYIYRRRLPHWRQEGAVYFVTWRLVKEQPDLRPEERSLIVSSLRHFENDRYQLYAFVVMNDHVHALVQPLGDCRLQDILHSWKSYTANVMQKQSARSGQVWQRESFDRIVRDRKELQEKSSYIANNAFKRWPGLDEYCWLGFAGDGSG